MPRNPIIIINNIWSEIKDLPPGGSDLLYDVLSFNVPDARFIIRYSNSNWDGKKHLFYRNRKESSSGKFRTGLVARTVQSLYDKFKILPVIIDQREKPEKTLNLEWNEKDFKLRDYQIEAVSNSIRKTRAVLEISTGGGKCVNEGTLCITEDGILPISYFALPYIGHEQYDTINLKIMNDGGTDCAKKIYYDGESNDSISIQTSTGYGIIGTKEHKIKILNKNGELEWKKLKNIEKKDTIAICRKPGIFGKSDLLKEDDAYFMGILCGDGSCVQRGTIIITNQDRHILDFCCGYLKKNNIKYTLKDSKSKAKDIFIHNVKFRKKLFLYGLGFEKSINKKWPIEILKSPSNIIASFVVGLFETDGWVENRPSINIGLSNKEFIRYLQIVLLNFGIIAQLQIKETSHQTSYVLHIYAENIKLFLEKIGLDKNGYKYKKIINCLKDRKYKKSNPNKDLFYADKKEFKQFYSKFKDRWRKIKLNYKDVFFKEFGINYNYFIACCRGDENIGSTMESNVISSKFYKKIYNKKIKI
ncbi:MAG: LAGLIDADG family homing endonuclease, partial [bacterium]|nr:LAGLIDADG family homing endonuclease [bacterium]